MARKPNPWVVAGIGVGVSLAGFFVYRALTSSSPAGSGSNTIDTSKPPPAQDPCVVAAQMAALRRHEYYAWADRCRQQGGSPAAFPGA
jgi:hypothetical protein